MKKLLFSLLSFLLFSACTKEDFGISSVDNPYDGRLVSVYGETITVSFYAEAAWDAVLELSSEGYTSSEIAGLVGAKPGTVRLWMTKGRRFLLEQPEFKEYMEVNQ